jgi:coenzyme PQQ biosynthesis protein PqqD
VIPLESRPRLAAKARLRFDRKSERYLLLYPERGLELNPSAGAIAALLSGERTVTGIVDALCAQYTTRPRDVIERDVLAFLASLEAHGLLETVP